MQLGPSPKKKPPLQLPGWAKRLWGLSIEAFFLFLASLARSWHLASGQQGSLPGRLAGGYGQPMRQADSLGRLRPNAPNERGFCPVQKRYFLMRRIPLRSAKRLLERHI